jgi:AraC-like DNA-binding protein
MLSNIILFITATLGLLCVAFIIGKNNEKEHSLINKYLIIIIAFQALRFMFYGISQAYPDLNIKWFTNFLDVLLVIFMPCFYLYFQNIIFENKFKVGNLLHFLTPTLLIVIFTVKIIASSENEILIRKIFLFTGVLFYLVYAYVGFKLLYQNVWCRKSEINAIQKQNALIKNWSIFLYASFIIIATVRLLTGFFINKHFINNIQYLWITALIWVSIFVKIILTPEILYGYNFLNKTIDLSTNKVILNSVWKVDGTVIPITSEKDIKLEEKIKSQLIKYLNKIEDLSFHTHTFRNSELTLDDIANTLNIPISHINFIFKYHCNESFTDYKKIVRIHDATKLLESGYLNNHKVETLSTEVGFSSYNTFNLAFKTIIGVTTQEYVKRF